MPNGCEPRNECSALVTALSLDRTANLAPHVTWTSVVPTLTALQGAIGLGSSAEGASTGVSGDVDPVPLPLPPPARSATEVVADRNHDRSSVTLVPPRPPSLPTTQGLGTSVATLSQPSPVLAPSISRDESNACDKCTSKASDEEVRRRHATMRVVHGHLYLH